MELKAPARQQQGTLYCTYHTHMGAGLTACMPATTMHGASCYTYTIVADGGAGPPGLASIPAELRRYSAQTSLPLYALVAPNVL
jgi:hypothetical protein